MPGITINTDVRSASVGTATDVVGQVFMVGEAERGPVDEPVLLQSFADYLKNYGLYESGNLYLHVREFFGEGGTRCWVRRVISDSSDSTARASLTSGSAGGEQIYKLATPIDFSDINLDGSELTSPAEQNYNYAVASTNAAVLARFPVAADDAAVVAGADPREVRIVNLSGATTSDSAVWTNGASQMVTGAATAPQALRDTAGEVIVIEAANPGAWANTDMSVRVLPPNSPGGGVRVEVSYLGNVEYVTNDFSNSQDGIYDLNHSGFSHLFRASAGSDLGNNDYIPDMTGDDPVVLSGGASSSPGNADIVGALNSLGPNLGIGAVCAPEHTDPSVWRGLREHASSYNRIALVSFDSSVSNVDAAKQVVSEFGFGDASRYVAAFYPYIEVESPSVFDTNDDSFDRQSDTLFISPVSYVAASRTKAIQEGGGPWLAFAGDISIASHVIDLQHVVQKSDSEELDEARINGIRTIGDQIKIYGARSLSNDDINWRYITYQDTINFVINECENRLEPFLFNTIDGGGALFGEIRGALQAFLETVRQNGGLFSGVASTGELLDPGYSIDVSDKNNPPEELARGRLNVNLALRVAPVADKVAVQLTKASTGASV